MEATNHNESMLCFPEEHGISPKGQRMELSDEIIFPILQTLNFDEMMVFLTLNKTCYLKFKKWLCFILECDPKLGENSLSHSFVWWSGANEHFLTKRLNIKCEDRNENRIVLRNLKKLSYKVGPILSQQCDMYTFATCDALQPRDIVIVNPIYPQKHTCSKEHALQGDVKTKEETLNRHQWLRDIYLRVDPDFRMDELMYNNDTDMNDMIDELVLKELRKTMQMMLTSNELLESDIPDSFFTNIYHGFKRRNIKKYAMHYVVPLKTVISSLKMVHRVNDAVALWRGFLFHSLIPMRHTVTATRCPKFHLLLYGIWLELVEEQTSKTLKGHLEYKRTVLHCFSNKCVSHRHWNTIKLGWPTNPEGADRKNANKKELKDLMYQQKQKVEWKSCIETLMLCVGDMFKAEV